eukprot:PITA_09074
MAPKRRRQNQNNLGVETPPPATSEIGTPAEQAILHSLGEMTNIFKAWVSSQGQDLGNVQKEVEQKQRQDLNSQLNIKDGQVTLDIMKEVQKSKLPEFTGLEGGSKAEAWVMAVKRALSFKAYTSTEKAQISMSLLKGDALLWWINEETKMQVTPVQVTWEMFEEAFRTRYLSEEYKHQQVGAFHEVRQNGRSIEDYEAEFYSLVHHVDYMVDDRRQAERFLHGLDPLVQAEVAMWKPTTMETTTSLAKQVLRKINMKKQIIVGENSGREHFTTRLNKPGGQPYRFQGRQNTISRIASATSQPPPRGRKGQPSLINGRNRRFGDQGREYKAKEGRQQNPHRIHVAINHRQAEHQAIAVESASMINNIPLAVLIDLGAIDSFISPSTILRCGLTAHEKSNFRMVEMASGSQQSVGSMVKYCSVNIGGCDTKMNLYSTTLGTYDLIVGMDWLESHKAILDCYNKTILIRNDQGETKVIKGIRRDVTLRLISAKKVNKCMRKGCKIYAVEMVPTNEKSSDKLHPLLSKFADVFPPELPGLPPV